MATACEHCGTALSDDALYCSACGHKTTPRVATPSAPVDNSATSRTAAGPDSSGPVTWDGSRPKLPPLGAILKFVFTLFGTIPVAVRLWRQGKRGRSILVWCRAGLIVLFIVSLFSGTSKSPGSTTTVSAAAAAAPSAVAQTTVAAKPKAKPRTQPTAVVAKGKPTFNYSATERCLKNRGLMTRQDAQLTTAMGGTYLFASRGGHTAQIDVEPSVAWAIKQYNFDHGSSGLVERFRNVEIVWFRGTSTALLRAYDLHPPRPFRGVVVSCLRSATTVAALSAAAPKPTVIPKSEHDALAWINSGLGGKSYVVRANVVDAEIALGTVANHPTVANVNQLALKAQQAHDNIDNIRADFAGGYGTDTLGNAELNAFSGANDLKNSMGALVAYAGDPNAATQAHFLTQFQTARSEWNQGIRTIWRLAHRKDPPTV